MSAISTLRQAGLSGRANEANTRGQRRKVTIPFLWRSTTSVAWWRLGRVGYGVEIAPAYAAVTLERLRHSTLSRRLSNSIPHPTMMAPFVEPCRRS